MKVTTVLATVLLAAPFAGAQDDKPAATSGGSITVGVNLFDAPGSSKLVEYKDLQKTLVPSFSLYSKTDKLDFKLWGANVSQGDQRYTGWFKATKFDVNFDWNQIVHNMGNGARTIQTELGPGVWGMSDTLQQTLGTTVNATPAAGRTVPFYDTLLGPSLANAGSVNVTSNRKRGAVSLDLSKGLPIDLTLSYVRELKTGYRGEEGGGIYSAVSSVMEIPSPLDDITQDIGVKAAYTFAKGNVHAGLNRNVYNNHVETLTIDNPFQWYDQPYVTSPAPAVGGGSRARWVLAPDNEATTVNAGFLFKFAKQTRLGGDFTMGKWTQDAPFYPYTINSALLTNTGARADSLQTLQRPSLNGKIDTTTLNLTFSSRPTDKLAVRASFRSYDLSNKTSRFVITGDAGATPDRDWTVVTATAGDPYGHATANVYDNKTSKFTGSASYDFGALTLEGQFHASKLERTSREAEKGDDNGYAISAMFHAKDWMAVRGTYADAKRTAEGSTLYGFQSDEAERTTKRTTLDVEFTLPKNFDLSFAYSLRDVKYPNRPNRIPVTSGAPSVGAVAFPNTPSGLLATKYDSYTAEIGYAPNEKVELGAYYTYEKDRQENQWSTTTGLALNNLLNYKGSDETDTFGVNAMFQLKPEVWTLSINAMRQKVDGLMDITAREAGSFYTPGRTGLIPAGQGGAADITDWDDTSLTTVTAQLDYHVATAWTVSAGYWYEKYEFADAYQVGNALYPQSVIFALKSNDGNYKANVVYGRLSYRF
jgi:hypothetical protein